MTTPEILESETLTPEDLAQGVMGHAEMESETIPSNEAMAQPTDLGTITPAGVPDVAPVNFGDVNLTSELGQAQGRFIDEPSTGTAFDVAMTKEVSDNLQRVAEGGAYVAGNVAGLATTKSPIIGNALGSLTGSLASEAVGAGIDYLRKDKEVKEYEQLRDSVVNNLLMDSGTALLTMPLKIVASLAGKGLGLSKNINAIESPEVAMMNIIGRSGSLGSKSTEEIVKIGKQVLDDPKLKEVLKAQLESSKATPVFETVHNFVKSKAERLRTASDETVRKINYESGGSYEDGKVFSLGDIFGSGLRRNVGEATAVSAENAFEVVSKKELDTFIKNNLPAATKGSIESNLSQLKKLYGKEVSLWDDLAVIESKIKNDLLSPSIGKPDMYGRPIKKAEAEKTAKQVRQLVGQLEATRNGLLDNPTFTIEQVRKIRTRVGEEADNLFKAKMSGKAGDGAYNESDAYLELWKNIDTSLFGKMQEINPGLAAEFKDTTSQLHNTLLMKKPTLEMQQLERQDIPKSPKLIQASVGLSTTNPQIVKFMGRTMELAESPAIFVGRLQRALGLDDPASMATAKALAYSQRAIGGVAKTLDAIAHPTTLGLLNREIVGIEDTLKYLNENLDSDPEAGLAMQGVQLYREQVVNARTFLAGLQGLSEEDQELLISDFSQTPAGQLFLANDNHGGALTKGLGQLKTSKGIKLTNPKDIGLYEIRVRNSNLPIWDKAELISHVREKEGYISTRTDEDLALSTKADAPLEGRRREFASRSKSNKEFLDKNTERLLKTRNLTRGSVEPLKAENWSKTANTRN